MMVALLIVLGCFIDQVSMMLITLPFYMLLAAALPWFRLIPSRPGSPGVRVRYCRIRTPRTTGDRQYAVAAADSVGLPVASANWRRNHGVVIEAFDPSRCGSGPAGRLRGAGRVAVALGRAGGAGAASGDAPDFGGQCAQGRGQLVAALVSAFVPLSAT